MNMTLEVIPVPVTDTDRAIEFYEGKLGWNKDMDVRMNESLRFVQLTPPGSSCSIHIGEGTSVMKPGSLKGMILVVHSVAEVMQAFKEKGIKMSEIQEMGWGKHVTFDDPDGNSWTLQESYTRNGTMPESTKKHLAS